MRVLNRLPLTSIRYVLRALGGVNLALNVLGVVVLTWCVYAPDAPGTVAVVLLAAAAVLALFAVEQARGELFGSQRLAMGTRTFTRVLLVAAALSIGAPDGPGAPTAAVGLVAMLLVVGESALRRPMRAATPPAANIPGWEIARPSVHLGNTYFVLNTLAMVALVVEGVVETGPWVSAPLALVSAGLAVALGLQAARFLVGRNAFERKLPRIMREMGPVFAFHWQAPAGTAYQAAMWLPHLERLGMPFFVLARTQANFAELAKMTDAPVILRTRLEDLDAIVCPSLKLVFYANTAVRNSHMIRFPHLTHIQLNHGDSDKIASVSPTFRQYDRNFVAGQAAVDRFATHGVPTMPEQFEIVGRPQLEDVHRVNGGVPAQPTVLYSPTWSGFYDDSDYSSLSAGVEIVRALLDRGCAVVFRPHPYARRHPSNAAACAEITRILTADAATTGRAHVYGERAETQMSVVDCFNASDAMVSDVSSLATDFLISSKPFAMAAVSAHGDEFAQQFPLSRAAYVYDVVDGRAEGFADLLEDMLGGDTLRETRLGLQTYYLSDTPPDQLSERFQSTVRRYV